MKDHTASFREQLDRRVRNRATCSIAIPSDRARLYFSGRMVQSVTVTDEVDPLSRSLPTEELTFRVFDFEQNLDPQNPSGYYAWFESPREVYLTFGILDDAGVAYNLDPEEYFVTEPPKWDNYIATFHAVKRLGLLEKTTYYGSRRQTLYDLAEDAMRDAGLEINLEYGDGVIDLSLRDMRIAEWNCPEPTSHADTLLQIAAASGCSIRTAPFSSFLGPRVYLRQEYLSNDALRSCRFLGVYFRDMYSLPTLERGPALCRERLVLTFAYDNFSASGEAEVLATYTDTAQSTDEQTIVLRHDPILTKFIETSNCTVLNDPDDSYPNCTVVRFVPSAVGAAVEITVKGFVFTPFTQERAYLIQSDGSEDDTLENPLVPISAAQTVARRRGEYLKNRNTYTVDYRGDPCIEPLDTIYVQLPYLGAVPCVVLRSELRYNGAFHGKLIVKMLEGKRNPAIAGIAIAGVAVSGAV